MRTEGTLITQQTTRVLGALCLESQAETSMCVSNSRSLSEGLSLFPRMLTRYMSEEPLSSWLR